MGRRALAIIAVATIATLGQASLAGSATRATGHGTWLYHSPAVILRSNAAGTAMAHPSAYRWFSGRDTSSILVYADDPYHPSPNTYTDQALQALGLSYTAHYDADFQGFESDLESGTWDLVIFADDNWFPPGSTLGKLTQYVHAGGTLIFQSWTVFANPSNPLYAELGFKWIQADTEPPHPEYWWDPSNPIFTTPQSAPQWTDLVGQRYGIYAELGHRRSGFRAIAGASLSPPNRKESLIVGNGERTIYKGFMDGMNDADLDADGIPDAVELWENMISFVL